MVTSKQEKLKTLRDGLVKLREERTRVTMEKGLAAEDNKDLRENASYDYWEQKEFNLTARIIALMKEIDKLAKSK
ncbi:MAG: hypothetical protein WC243_01075 [Patescibacteria group bacterium]|jgi:hypothetical protein